MKTHIFWVASPLIMESTMNEWLAKNKIEIVSVTQCVYEKRLAVTVIYTEKLDNMRPWGSKEQE
jgi:hypothetical protein